LGGVSSKLHLIILKVRGKVDWFHLTQHKARDGCTIGHSLTLHTDAPATGTHMARIREESPTSGLTVGNIKHSCPGQESDEVGAVHTF
jgi:hypothetical protein